MARFSPIEWKISRPPTCDNYFADRIRRKWKKADCNCESEIDDTVNRTADKIVGSDRVHNKIEKHLDNNSGPDDDHDNDNALHYPDWCNEMNSSYVSNAIDQIRSTADHLENSKLLSTSNGETDDGDDELDSISDKSICNESCEMLAHHSHHLDDQQQMQEMHQTQHNNDIIHAHDEYHYHYSSMRPPLNTQHQHEHCNSSDSHCGVMDTHICDFVDCDGLQETELLCSENDFTLTNSFWFSIGTLMQQDDLNPKVLFLLIFIFVGLKEQKS